MSAAALALDVPTQHLAPALPPLRRLPLPVAEPHPALRLVRDEDQGPSGPTQEALALTGQAQGAPRPDDVDQDGPAEPRAWAGRYVQAAVEIAAGLRSPAQLTRWSSGDVHGLLTRRHQVALRLRRREGAVVVAHRARVATVRTCTPRPGVVEATAVVRDALRTRAVALRLEDVGGGWLVTALEIG